MNFLFFLRKDLSRIQKNKLLSENSIKPIKYSIYNDDVRKAFIDFTKLASPENFIIIGAIALGAYSTPRNTNDVDILVMSSKDIDIIEKEVKSKFKRNRKSAFEHKQTGVEIEVVYSESVNISQELIRKAIVNSKNDNGIKIATPKYLIALKLGRASGKPSAKSMQDESDIFNLLQIYGIQDLTDLSLSKKELNLYNKLIKKL